MTSTTETITLPPTDTRPYSKMEYDRYSITFHIKPTSTWKEMNVWLEETYGDNGKDKHWKWMGFGKEGQEGFQVIVVRRPCSEYICDCVDDSESEEESDDE